MLYSGSLASTVAARLAHRAGVAHLRLVYFRSPLFLGEDEVVSRAHRWLGEFRLQSVALKREGLAVNRGGAVCPVCRRSLLGRVQRLARRARADLLVTGEVVGRGGLGVEELVELDRALGLSGRVLRPLSAHLLPPTAAERDGMVDRLSLLGLTGERDPEDGLRAVARELGVEPWAGGRRCVLSDRAFVRRWAEIAPDAPVTENLVQLLQFDHIYRIGTAAQVVIARSAEEQARLQPLFLPSDVRLYVQIPHSPLALVRAPWADYSPGEREAIIAAAAERMAEAAGLPRATAWVVRFRCEWEGETRRMRLPIEGEPLPALISS